MGHFTKKKAVEQGTPPTIWTDSQWNQHPVGVVQILNNLLTREKTIIEGKVFFDRAEDAKKRTAIKKEKSTLINMMLKEKIGGGKTKAPMKRKDRNFQCDTLEELKS